MFPVAPELLIPAVEAMRSVAPEPCTKSLFVPVIIPAAVMLRSPLFVNVRCVAPDTMFTEPAIVPLPAAVIVIFILFPAFPSVSVFPEATENVPVIVNVFPLAEDSKSQEPLIISARRLMDGTAVIFPVRSDEMITESPGAGCPLGLQFPAIVQVPPAPGIHVLVAA
jgi:hypothetical protein